MIVTTTVQIAGRSLAVHGNHDDYYFQQAQVHADGLAPLRMLVDCHVKQDGGLLVDVGANIGLSTMALALAHPLASVIAVEPSPVNADLLRRNLAANGFGAVEVVEAAMADRTGTLTVHQNSAWTSVVDPARIPSGMVGVSVPVITLDTLTAGKGRVAFVKIDTEGYEPHVLAGSRTVLERDQPLLFIEFNAWCLTGVSGFSPAAFANMLWDRFVVQQVDAAGTLTTVDDSATTFLHATMTERGLVEDLVLRLRPGAAVPSLEHMAMHDSFANELHRLRADNAALLGSTSWHITAPLREAMTLLRRWQSRP